MHKLKTTLGSYTLKSGFLDRNLIDKNEKARNAMKLNTLYNKEEKR